MVLAIQQWGQVKLFLALEVKKIYISHDFLEIVVFPTARATGADEQEDYI